ncbi:TniQ family protein [Chryseobacterium scophthalmum]|uniref:TniQ protein n=1 Tax=Chryseobacterium scophthalmum TaxID=59733 RepID=A0A1N6HHM2_9FLAO|nr:TniQ family protein [Chryseobacterium scophthalmum]SIO19145.1 TniQ protein [Chryseobacterium scophthalmum]
MVYIKSFDKDIFPLYIAPNKNELFSSWINRLSINHEVKTQTFLKNFFPKSRSYFTRDIDILAPNNLIETINRYTPLSISQINNLFLKSFEGYAFENINTKTITINVLPIGIVNRSKFKHGLQACVKCLNEYKYYQKQWRLSSSILCLDCKLYLIDRCPECNHPLHFFKINKGGNRLYPANGFKPFNICYNCFFDYSLIDLNHLVVSNKLDLQYQKYINSTINIGYNEFTSYSFLFLKVFLIIASRLRSNSHKGIFNQFLKDIYHFDLEIINENISFWDLQTRIETFPLAYKILKEQKFYDQLNHYKIAKSYIYSEKSGIPYWFEKKLIY